MLYKIIYAVIAVLFVFLSAANAVAVGYMPGDGVEFPVKITLNDGATGTGFFLNHESFTYLVTAKQVFFQKDAEAPSAERAELISYGRDPNDKSPNIIQLDLADMVKTRNLRWHPTHDIAIGRIAKIETKDETKLLKLFKWARAINWTRTGIARFDTKDAVTRFSDVRISTDVIVYCYPSLIGIKYFPQMNYDRPLLRKGIVAGVNHKTGWIIIDANVNAGYLGGPVIAIGQNPMNANLKLIGIIGRQLSYAEDRLDHQSSNFNSESLNSGFGVVFPVDSILEILWQD